MDEKNNEMPKGRYDIINPPYTVVGSPVIPERQSLTMKVGGIRKMITDLSDGDLLTVTWFPGYKATKYSVSKKA